MRRLWSAGFAIMLALASGALVIDAARGPRLRHLKDITRRKLNHAQRCLKTARLLIGIIEREADPFYRLSDASAWNVVSTSE